jgi:hypothetical protein
MSIEHTPGPWILQVYSAETTHEAHEVFANDPDGSYIGGVNLDNPSHVANGRLIAAAPDLLEAVKALSDRMGCGCGGDNSLCHQCDKADNMALAAIHKATYSA